MIIQYTSQQTFLAWKTRITIHFFIKSTQCFTQCWTQIFIYNFNKNKDMLKKCSLCSDMLWNYGKYWKCTKTHSMTLHVLSTTFWNMEHLAQCCFHANDDFWRPSCDVILFLRKQSKSIWTIAISLLLEKLLLKFKYGLKWITLDCLSRVQSWFALQKLLNLCNFQQSLKSFWTYS